MLRARVGEWWRRWRGTDRLVHTPGEANEIAEHQAARQRLIEEAERRRGQPEGGRHRWYDGATVGLPLVRRSTPLLTYGQQCGYRRRG